MTMILLPRFSLLLVVALFGSCPLDGQAPTHLPGQILVSLLPNTLPEKLAQRSSEELAAPILVREKVAERLHIWRLETAPTKSAEIAALNWLNRQPEVQAAQLNHLVTYRDHPPNTVLPNDPLFEQQWHYINSGSNGGLFDADLDAEQAWVLATGGLTAAGDTVVVAVIDGGVDFQHPDLAPNAWYNWAEIPNDGLDNDGNGFIDDFRGWNVGALNDDISGQTTGHGTPVCGILGARGNNGIGVAGVNWQVKIMFVAGSGTEASILAAYDYVLAARRLYNATNGKHGAFVTALNCSWGVDTGQPLDAPLWCAAFDSLGKAGILSVAATTNLPLNVDVTGDLPTACTSDYLITVTSLQRNDQKAILAGWGLESIDLGAYGQNVFTLGAGNTYGSFSGTSFAAPQVAGAVGLLYSMPCANLIAVAKNDPSTAALWVKDLLLGSTTPNPSLAAFTKTGGRLNLYNLLEDYTELCNPCPAPFSLSAEIVDDFALLSWSQIPDYQIFNLQYRQVGQTVWNVKEAVNSPYILPVSGICQPYEFSVQAYCQSGQASAWSAPVQFSSGGCCAPPAAIMLQMATTTTLNLQWPDAAGADSWIVRYRVVGSNALWLKTVANSNAVNLTNLHPCTSYEVQIQSACNGSYTPFSALFKFTTEGCGSCTLVPYCAANAGQSSGEWISSVAVGNWLQSSGNGGGGYQNFTGDQYLPLELHPLDTLPVTVTPGFFSTPVKEYFRIYVDFNADGDFGDAGELAFDPGYAQNGPITGHLHTPEFTNSGFTRMRVLMKAKNA
ncbi:MAG: S8 family serine peptidase, partial [Saprospiraceae bacterium]